MPQWSGDENMSRMLRALKNLEAKEAASPKQGARAAATGRQTAATQTAPMCEPQTVVEQAREGAAVAVLEAPAAVTKPPAEAVTKAPSMAATKAPAVAVVSTKPRSDRAIAPRIIEVVDKLDAVVKRELAGSAGGYAATIGSRLPAFSELAFWGQPKAGFAPVKPIAAAALVEPRPASSPTVIAKAPSELERQLRRAISDPVRREPLLDLVDRLVRDVEQTESKVLTFVSLGGSADSKLPVIGAAVLLAEKRGKKVLLIDGDLARGPLSKALESERCAGLNEVATGKLDLKSSFQPTATVGLSFLPAGQLQTKSDPAAVEAAEQLPRLVKGDFDLVLIDAGSAWDEAVCSALACASDATYLVVELGAVEMVTAQAALARLRSAGARVLGCIAI